MAEHLTEEQLQLFRRNKLSPADLLSVDDHLAGCAECRAVASLNPEVLAAASDLCSSLTFEPLPKHLSYSQLESLVDETADAVLRMHCDSHLASCHTCRDEVDHLLQLKEAEEPINRKSANNLTIVDRIRSLISLQNLALAAAAVVVLLFGWYAIRHREADTSPESIAANSEPASTAPQPANENTQTRTPNVVEMASPSPDISPAELVVQLRDGNESVGLSRSGDLVGYADAPPSQRQLLERVLKTGEVPVGDVRDLSPARSATMGEQGTSPETNFKVHEPVGEVLLTSRPTFSWEKLDGAEGYVVDVYDTKFNKQGSSGRITANNWTAHLARGKTYIWQVIAFKDQKEIKAPQRPAPEARFHIVDEAHASSIERARLVHPNAHLLLGTLYAEAGMLKEALGEFNKLAEQNPKSDLVHKLIRTMGSSR